MSKEKINYSNDFIASIPEMRRITRIHFIGIGGAGMCGIAEVLNNQGYTISASDLKPSANTERLTALGATVRFGHSNRLCRPINVIDNFIIFHCCP